jgi:hypothetical protein
MIQYAAPLKTSSAPAITGYPAFAGMTALFVGPGATLSHKGRGKIRVRLAGNCYTRIGIST